VGARLHFGSLPPPPLGHRGTSARLRAAPTGRPRRAWRAPLPALRSIRD